MFAIVRKILDKLFTTKKNYISIRFKLVAAFSIMIIPIFLLGFVSQNLTSRAIEKRVILSTSETIEQSAKLLDILLLNVKDEYIKILASSQIQDYYNFEVNENDETARTIKKTLKTKANYYLTNRVLSSTVISDIWILADEDNSLGTKMLPLQFDYDYAGNIGWYKKSLDIKSRLTFFGYHPELDIKGRDYSYAMFLAGSIKRIIGNSFINKSVGVMVIDIDLDYIEKILLDIDLGSRGEIHIVSFDGRDVSTGSDTVKTGSAVSADLASLIISHKSNSNEMVLYNNEKYFMSVKKMGSTNFIIVGLQPKSEIMAAARSINIWTVILILIAIGTAFVLGLIITIGIGGRISNFKYKMEKVARGNLDVSMSIRGGDEIAALGKGFNNMISDLKQYINESVKNEKIKKEMEINLLISQINPHLIYNTLNSVIYLAKENKNKDIVKMVEAFISLLQDSIKIGDEGIFATIKQEIESIENYCLIQKYRYPGRFQVVWDIDKDLFTFKVPKTIIQPLVENSLFHGICPGERQGTISIVIEKTGDYIRIVVGDNGEGMDSGYLENIFANNTNDGENPSVRSIGLSNIQERIRYFYGTDGSIEIESTPGKGTSVEMILPVKNTYIS